MALASEIGPTAPPLAGIPGQFSPGTRAAGSDVRHQRGRQTVHCLRYHLVWIPRRRWPVLRGPVATSACEVLTGVATEHGWNMQEVAVRDDHVQRGDSGQPVRAVRRRAKRGARHAGVAMDERRTASCGHAADAAEWIRDFEAAARRTL
ncbi:MAG: transposase, partial [bacterium]